MAELTFRKDLLKRSKGKRSWSHCSVTSLQAVYLTSAFAIILYFYHPETLASYQNAQSQHMTPHTLRQQKFPSLNGNRLGQIAREIDVETLANS